MELSQQLNSIRIGHICLVLCCVFYLIWWSITFNPMKTFPSQPKYILFACIVVSAVAGGIFLLTTLRKLPVARGGISNFIIMLAGVAAYIVLLYLTSHFLHRQVTTELLLIVGWTVLELCVLSGIYRANGVGLQYAVIMALVVVAAAIVSMVCYLFYYELEAMAGFYDGMVPLILFAVVMSVQALLIKIS